MADDNILGAVKIEIRGDWSKLASDFASAEGTARNLAASITGNLNSAFQQVNATAISFGNNVRAAVSNAGASIGSLNTATQQMAANLANAATQAQALSGSFRNLVASLNAQVAAAQAATAAYQQMGAAAIVAAGAANTNVAATNTLRSTYLSLGLAVRTIRIGEMVARGIESIVSLVESVATAREKIVADFRAINLGIQTTGDELAVANAKIENTLAKLSGRPQDAIAEGMRQGAVHADKLAKSLDEVIQKLLNSKDSISRFRAAFTGEIPTTPVTEQIGGKSGEGAFRAQAAQITEKYAEAIRKASTATEQDNLVTQRNKEITDAAALAVKNLQSAVQDLSKPSISGILGIGGILGNLLFGTQGSGAIDQALASIKAIKDATSQLPAQAGVDQKQRQAEEIETNRSNAARAAVVPKANVEAQLASISQETHAREQASQAAIALARETAKGEIEAMRDPHARAIANAQDELKAAKEAQAALLATQQREVPRQTAAIQQRGNLEAAGKAPEEAQAARIGAARQVQEVNAEASLKRQEAASTVALAEAKVTATVAQQNREIDQSTQKTAAKLAATRESAALEAQALQVEREVGVAAGATGAVKITQMRAQADAQAAQRDGEVRRLQQEADAEGDQTKKAELLAQAEEKRLENANKTYAAETKILEVMAQQAKQLAEIETKRRGQVEDAGIGQQKALAQRAATLQGPGITPQATAANEIALKQQLLALDTQQHSLDVERLATQGDIAALYGDQIAAAKDYAEADKVAADSLTKEIQQQTEILALQKQQTLQAELQGNLRSALSGAEAGVGQGVAGAVLGKKGPGDSVGQEIEKSLRNVGQQLFGNVLTTVIRQLVTSLTANTAASTVLHAIFGTATAAQTTATAANTAATLTGTAATAVNTLSQTVLTASNVALATALTANTTALLVSTFVPKPLGFAEGGSPPVGVTSIVGENGPELFVPKEAGTIVPAGKFGPAGGAGSYGAALPALPSYSNVTNSGSVSIGSFHMQVHGPSSPKQFASEVMKEIAYRAKSQGGPGFSPLSRAFQGASGGTNS